MNEPSKSARVTRGGLNAGDLPVETVAEGTGTSLVEARAALFVVDIQERLLPALPAEVAAQVVRYTTLLVEAARVFGLPVVVSQQYPRGLGGTAPAVEAALQTLAPGQLHRFDKLEFSAVATADFAKVWPALGRNQWLVCGMETHVCVYQTVRDLRAKAATVWIASDAVASRSKANWRNGLRLMEADGATISNTESIVFDLLGRAGGVAFKSLSQLIK